METYKRTWSEQVPYNLYDISTSLKNNLSIISDFLIIEFITLMNGTLHRIGSDKKNDGLVAITDIAYSTSLPPKKINRLFLIIYKLIQDFEIQI